MHYAASTDFCHGESQLNGKCLLTVGAGGESSPSVWLFIDEWNSLRFLLCRGYSSPFDEYFNTLLLLEGVCLLLLVDTLMWELTSGGWLCFSFQMNLLSSVSCVAGVWNTLLLQVPCWSKLQVAGDICLSIVRSVFWQVLFSLRLVKPHLVLEIWSRPLFHEWECSYSYLAVLVDPHMDPVCLRHQSQVDTWHEEVPIPPLILWVWS